MCQKRLLAFPAGCLSVPRSLGDKVVSLKNKRDEIIAELDLLFTGI